MLIHQITSVDRSARPERAAAAALGFAIALSGASAFAAPVEGQGEKLRKMWDAARGGAPEYSIHRIDEALFGTQRKDAVRATSRSTQDFSNRPSQDPREVDWPTTATDP